MTITINIENAAEYQWIAKYLDDLQNHPMAKVNIHNADEAAWDKAVDGLRDFIKNDAAKVDKIEWMTREERNAR